MTILTGIRIVSFNHFLMGPLAIQHLADLGAEVIAVEPIDGAFQRKWGGANTDVDGQTMLLLSANRNKESIALDLKKPRGVEIAKALIQNADVVAENYRPGVMERFGLGYEALKQLKPDIIYAAGSGYGADGPWAAEPGQDLLVQAMSGLAMVTGSSENGPRAVGVSAVDHHGASLLALGILAAIIRRLQTGVGGRVDVSLLDAAIDLQLESLTCFLNSSEKPEIRPTGPRSGWYFPAPYGIYETRDGHIAISLSDLELLYDALSIPSSQQIPNDDAYERRDEVTVIIADALQGLGVAEVIDKLSSKRIWHAKVNDYDDLINHPQVRHLNKFQTVPGATGRDVTLVGNPIHIDGKSPTIRRPPEKLGAQTKKILGEIGLSNAEIDELVKEGVVHSS